MKMETKALFHHRVWNSTTIPAHSWYQFFLVIMFITLIAKMWKLQNNVIFESYGSDSYEVFAAHQCPKIYLNFYSNYLSAFSFALFCIKSLGLVYFVYLWLRMLINYVFYTLSLLFIWPLTTEGWACEIIWKFFWT